MQTLVSYIVSVDPKISVIPNFLSELECEFLISKCEKIGFIPSLVGRGIEGDDSENFINVESENRTSSSVTLSASDVVIQHIVDKLSAVANIPISYLESLVIVKYKSGEFFKPHHDGHFRTVTVFIYLNEGLEGGDARFTHLGLQVKPALGTAVMWSNKDARLVHEGLPPEGWTKYGVNCFFNDSPMS